MKDYPHIKAAIYGEPWMTTEHGLQTIIAIVENAVAGGKIEEQFAAMPQKPVVKIQERYQVVDGIAIIPVKGSLIPHANLFSRMSGATSYDEITAMVDDAMSRLDVETVALDISSLGGAVEGCFECAANIFSARDKMTVAVIGGNGCSAAYLLASQCQYVVSSGTSNVGSIGVIIGVNDTSRAEKNQGNDSMIFRSKELKAPGTGPMTPNQMQSIQRKMMQLDGMFEDVVKAARPQVAKEAFTGESFLGRDARSGIDAISFGLVDAIMNMDEAIDFFGSKMVS